MKVTSLRNDESAKSYGVGRNRTTRVLHVFCGGSSRCGSSRKNLIVPISEAVAASESSFCEKCFPDGKPAEFFEIEV